MQRTSTALPTPFLYGVRDVFSRFLDGVSETVTTYQTILDGQRDFEALSAMNDAQLSKLGLTRDDVMRHAFRGILSS